MFHFHTTAILLWHHVQDQNATVPPLRSRKDLCLDSYNLKGHPCLKTKVSDDQLANMLAFDHLPANISIWLCYIIPWERCESVLKFQRTYWTHLFKPGCKNLRMYLIHVNWGYPTIFTCQAWLMIIQCVLAPRYSVIFQNCFTTFWADCVTPSKVMLAGNSLKVNVSFCPKVAN